MPAEVPSCSSPAATSVEIVWPQAPDPIRLDADDVHVWAAELTSPLPDGLAASETLAPDEQDKARAIRFEHDRARYVAAHAILRDILAHYVGRAPGAIVIKRDAHGKPFLADTLPGDGIMFSMSHAADLALYAIRSAGRVGIDVERLVGGISREGLAERFFSSNEVTALSSIPLESRDEAFIRCWTRKEAYAKARGAGLQIPLDSFDVSLSLDEPAEILAVRDLEDAGTCWSMHHLTPARGYVGALAVDAPVVQVTCWRWEQA